MRRARHFNSQVTLVVFCCFLLLTTPCGWSWQSRALPTTVFPPQTNPPSTHSGLPDLTKGEDKDGTRVRMEESAAKARNSERFKRLQSDTEKLLKLSTELKEDVDKSTKNELSLDVIRKAAEVEKLAHDIKERMRG